MMAYDVESGDRVHAGNPVTVDRYTGGARINHWITATCLVLLRALRAGAVPSEPLLPHRLAGGGQLTRAVIQWLIARLCITVDDDRIAGVNLSPRSTS